MANVQTILNSVGGLMGRMERPGLTPEMTAYTELIRKIVKDRKDIPYCLIYQLILLSGVLSNVEDAEKAMQMVKSDSGVKSKRTLELFRGLVKQIEKWKGWNGHEVYNVYLFYNDENNLLNTDFIRFNELFTNMRSQSLPFSFMWETSRQEIQSITGYTGSIEKREAINRFVIAAVAEFKLHLLNKVRIVDGYWEVVMDRRSGTMGAYKHRDAYYWVEVPLVDNTISRDNRMVRSVNARGKYQLVFIVDIGEPVARITAEDIRLNMESVTREDKIILKINPLKDLESEWEFTELECDFDKFLDYDISYGDHPLIRSKVEFKVDFVEGSEGLEVSEESEDVLVIDGVTRSVRYMIVDTFNMTPLMMGQIV